MLANMLSNVKIFDKEY